MSALNRKVLVLNKSMTAINVVSMKRAIKLLCKTDQFGGPKAHIIDEDCMPWTWEEWREILPEEGEDNIQGIYRIPEIIKVNTFDRVPKKRVHFSRAAIFKRDKNRCQFCGARPGTPELNLDHIEPRSKGGETTWENVVCACVECNSLKADKRPEDVRCRKFPNGMPRPKPRRPTYNMIRGDIHYKSWSQWLSVSFWNTELENDNK